MYGPPSYGQPFLTLTVSKTGMIRAHHASQSPAYLETQGVPHKHRPPPRRMERGCWHQDSHRGLTTRRIDVDSWQYLVDPFLSQEERNSLNPEASEQGDPEAEEEITGTSDDLPEDMVELYLKRP